MGSKTPVSILQEMMVRLGTLPKYDPIYESNDTHSTIFKYKVYANDVTAIGSGRSKKEAKHEAARIALERLASHQITDSDTSGVSPPPVEVVTPYKDHLKENAVGALHDMCAVNEIPIPDYKLVGDEGAPHEKVFTYVCFVSKLREIGIGRTKKQAKQLAAYHMMNRLKKSFGNMLMDVENEQIDDSTGDKLDNAISKNVGSALKKYGLNKRPYMYHNSLSEMMIEGRESAWEILSEIQLPQSILEAKDVSADWMVLLTKVLKCLDVQETVVPGKPLPNGNETLFLQIPLSVEAVFHGFGCNAEVALQHAALLALKFLKLQMQANQQECSSGSVI